MGQYGLELYRTTDFVAFLQRSGYTDEYDFWSSLSGLSKGTTTDHMIAYLTAEGYTGSPFDMFRQWLEEQQGNIGTVMDMAHPFFQGTFTTGTFNVLDDDGNVVRDDDGNIVTD